MAKIAGGEVNASITAENTFSDALMMAAGAFNFSLSGTWTATVHVQRRYEPTGDWMDIDSFTSNGEYPGDEPESDTEYRFGIKTGNISAGTVVGRLSRGGVKNI